MAIRVDQLAQAARRYQSFHEARATADPAHVDNERVELALRNAALFTPRAARLPALAMVAGAAARSIGGATPGLLTIVEAGREAMRRENDLRPIRFLQVALLAARCVGKITVRGVADEEGDATGFLVAPGVLLTNHHVLPNADFAAASWVMFDFEDGLDGRPKEPRLFDLRPEELYVSDEALDYAFVGVARRTADGVPLSQYGYLRLFKQTGKLNPERREAANIIQHPLGQGKKIAVRDNYFEEAPKDSVDAAGAQNSLFYGTDTLSGSSGSPVCSDEWYVVALHRGGVPKTQTIDGKLVVMRRDGTPARDGDASSTIAYVTNEGTRVSRLYASLAEKAAQRDDGSAHAAAALSRIEAIAKDPRSGPIDQLTAPILLPTLSGGEFGAIEEKLVRRTAALFAGAKGYNATFLGARFRVSLPTMGAEVKKEAAKLKGSTAVVLKYDHYSLVMHAKRRTAIFVAGNVDGRLLWKNQQNGAPLPQRPSWTFDPRMSDDFQPDDAIFSNAMQRGHLFKREDAVWAATEAGLDRADKQSFTITNATPMIANFNNVEWGDLEDIITGHLLAGGKVSYFAGPVFDIEDRYFNELKKGVAVADRKKGMRVPSSFWKVVAWVEDGKLKVAGFVLDQSDEIKAHGPIEEEIDFGKYRQKPIDDIALRTGLSFPGLARFDTLR